MSCNIYENKRLFGSFVFLCNCLLLTVTLNSFSTILFFKFLFWESERLLHEASSICGSPFSLYIQGLFLTAVISYFKIGEQTWPVHPSRAAHKPEQITVEDDHRSSSAHSTQPMGNECSLTAKNIIPIHNLLSYRLFKNKIKLFDELNSVCNSSISSAMLVIFVNFQEKSDL